MSDRGDPLIRLSDVTGAMGEVLREYEQAGLFRERDRDSLHKLAVAMIDRVQARAK